MKIIRVIIGIIAVCLAAAVTQAQDSARDFPVVTEHEIINAEERDYFSISNNAEYIYGCYLRLGSCGLLNKVTDEGTSLTPGDGLLTYWSKDNRFLITTNLTPPCESSLDDPNIVVFDTQTETVSNLCLNDGFVSLKWSPIIPTSALVNSQYLLDFTTMQTSPFSPPVSSISQQDLERYVGYDRYLWDPDTNTLAGVLYFGQDTNGSFFDHSAFEICTYHLEQCITVLNTLDYSGVDVFRWGLNGNWLLWAGHLAASGQAEPSRNPTRRSDTIVYITDIVTGATQELFRFSSLARNDVYVRDMAWSPDGHTVALSLGAFNPPTPMPPGPEYTPSDFRAGVLLLTLDWPQD
jgi:hypothetical protein